MRREVAPRTSPVVGKLETRLAHLSWEKFATAVLAVFDQNCSPIYEAFGRKGVENTWYLNDELRRDVWDRARKLWASGRDYIKFPFSIDAVADLYMYFCTTKFMDQHRKALEGQAAPTQGEQ